MVKLYNNQIGINVHSPSRVEAPFFSENNDLCFAVMRDLGGNAYMLWQYIACNANGYQFGLSKADVSEHIGLGESAYKNAVKKLIEKGYLVQVEGTPWYNFFRNGKNGLS